MTAGFEAGEGKTLWDGLLAEARKPWLKVEEWESVGAGWTGPMRDNRSLSPRSGSIESWAMAVEGY